ncbi:MAG: hypothetical protein AAGC57_10750 [Pseudomonadota bacterium]
MTRPILAALVAAVAVTAALPADAMRRGDNAVSQSRAKLEKEWRRARANGGYGNPVSALLGILAGQELRPGTLQPSFTSSTAVDANSIR